MILDRLCLRSDLSYTKLKCLEYQSYTLYSKSLNSQITQITYLLTCSLRNGIFVEQSVSSIIKAIHYIQKSLNSQISQITHLLTYSLRNGIFVSLTCIPRVRECLEYQSYTLYPKSLNYQISQITYLLTCSLRNGIFVEQFTEYQQIFFSSLIMLIKICSACTSKYESYVRASKFCFILGLLLYHYCYYYYYYYYEHSQ